MNGEEFIAISKICLSLGEAGCRSATSRAYYGAFHLTLDLLRELQCPLPDRCGHDKPINCLGYAAPGSSARAASTLLGNLQNRRIRADYQLQELGAGEALYGEYSIAIAENVASLLREFRQECDAEPALKASFCASVLRYIQVNFWK